MLFVMALKLTHVFVKRFPQPLHSPAQFLEGLSPFMQAFMYSACREQPLTEHPGSLWVPMQKAEGIIKTWQFGTQT